MKLSFKGSSNSVSSRCKFCLRKSNVIQGFSFFFFNCFFVLRFVYENLSCGIVINSYILFTRLHMCVQCIKQVGSGSV